MFLLFALADALAAPWYQGKEVAQVSLTAPEGGLPDENLAPLLAAQQGDRLDRQVIRQDLALLYRVGNFETVEAFAEPWVVFTPEGDPVDAVHLVYEVAVAPLIRRIEVDGLTGPQRLQAQRIVDDALRVDRGTPFYDEDLEPTQTRITNALINAGWPQADVAMGLVGTDPESLTLAVEVTLGPLLRYSDVAIQGDHGLSLRRLRRVLRKAGIAKRKRLEVGSLADGRTALLEELQQAGYLEARVNLVLPPSGTALQILIEAGPRLEVSLSGRPQPSESTLWSLVGTPDRLADLDDDDARNRVADWYYDRGYAQVEVQVDRRESDVGTQLAFSVRAGARHKLREIRIEGAEAFSQRYLEGALREAAPASLGRGIATRKATEEALGALRDFYRGQGFLSASVELEKLTFHRRGPWATFRHRQPTSIHLIVDEGVRTDLVEVATVGGTGNEAEVLEAVVPTLVGQPYRPAALERLALEVSDAVREEGHLRADTRVVTTLSQDGSTARVRFEIEPGPQFLLRSVVIRGNQRTRRRAVARTVPLHLGDPITPDGINRTRSALYEMDTFRVVSPELIGEDDRVRDLVLNLEEKQNLLFELGGGVSTDQGISALGRATHRNLLGLAHKLSLSGRMGFAWRGDEWTLETAEPVWRAGLAYEAPYVPGRGQKLLVDVLLNEILQEPRFRLSRSGASVGVQFDVAQRSEAVFGYRLQRRRLEDIDPGALVLGEPWLDPLGVEADLTSLSTPSDFRSVGVVELGWITDWRDDRFNPKAGTYLSGIAAIGDNIFAEVPTLRAQGRLQQLWPLGPLVVDIVGTGGVGWAAGLETTLGAEDRFYLGGASTLRGFRPDSIGPANEVVRPAVDYPPQIGPLVIHQLAQAPVHWVPTGGDGMLMGSFNVRIPLPVLGFASFDSTSLVLFTDVGHVGFLDDSISTTSRLEDRDPLVRAGIGAGLRIETPIGPASLDLGFNPWPISEREEALVLPHLSIGAL